MPGTGERGQDGRPVHGRREASGGDTRGTDDGSGGEQPGDGSGGDLPVPELAKPAAAAAERLRDADSVLVVSHNDADGIASATVATRMLERADVPYELRFSRQLNGREVDRIAAYASGESPEIKASDLDELFRSYRDEVMAATDELEDAVDDVLDDEDGAIRASQRRRAFRTYRTEKQAAAVDRVERTIERLHGLRPEADDEAGVQTTLEDRNSWARADGSGGASVVGHLDPNDRGANDEQPVPPMTSDGDEKPDGQAASESVTADDGNVERDEEHAPTERDAREKTSPGSYSSLLGCGVGGAGERSSAARIRASDSSARRWRSASVISSQPSGTSWPRLVKYPSGTTQSL